MKVEQKKIGEKKKRKREREKIQVKGRKWVLV